MFLGALTQDMRQVLKTILPDLSQTDVWVGCSGNFTIERMLLGRAQGFHGCDVSLYTCVMGRHLTGQPLGVTVKDERFRWLEPYMQDNIGVLATIILAQRMFMFDKPGTYNQRMFEAYTRDWDKLLTQTRTRVEAALDGLSLKSFFEGDVVDFCTDLVDRDGCVISYPPIYVGGDYEKQYRKLEETFEWGAPSFTMFSPERLATMKAAMMECRHWVLGTDTPQDDLADYHQSTIRAAMRGNPRYLYAGSAKRRVLVMPNMRTQGVTIPHMQHEDEIRPDSEIKFVNIAQGQLDMLRSLYLAKWIVPGAAMIAWAITVDGKLAGVLAFGPGKFNPFEIYLYSDFPITGTRYRRLSKLTIALALTHEVKGMLEAKMVRPLDLVVTTAFTQRAVSMRYRGVFFEHSRKPGVINYAGKLGKWSIPEAVAWFLKHHARPEHILTPEEAAARADAINAPQEAPSGT